jgi:hypothetical protein
MELKVGVMGSADDALAGGVGEAVRERALELGREIAARDLLCETDEFARASR